MKITEQIQRMTDLGKSRKDKQSEISVSEVFHLWDNLKSKYHIIKKTMILRNFVTDADFKMVIDQGLKFLEEEAKMLEKEMDEFGLNMPTKPPEKIHIPLEVEAINDEFVFQEILQGLQGVLPQRMTGIMRSTNPRMREIFKNHLLREIDLFDKLVDYGKLKNWITEPPRFRV
jgi:spore coat protein CotF